MGSTELAMHDVQAPKEQWASPPRKKNVSLRPWLGGAKKLSYVPYVVNLYFFASLPALLGSSIGLYCCAD